MCSIDTLLCSAGSQVKLTLKVQVTTVDALGHF